MPRNYDNWERLVSVALRREHDKQLALMSDDSSSNNSSVSSSFRSNSELDFLNDDSIVSLPRHSNGSPSMDYAGLMIDQSTHAGSILSNSMQQDDIENLAPHDLDAVLQPLSEASQPMEGPRLGNYMTKRGVITVENAPRVENQANDEPQSLQFKWKIEKFSQLNTKKLYSDVFAIGNYKWRLLIFPKGNNVDFLSVYLAVAGSAFLPKGWRKYAQFSLAVVDQRQCSFTIRKGTGHEFKRSESDWGFTSFMPLSDLYDPHHGYVVNDLLVVEAIVVVRNIDLYSIIKVARDEDLKEQIGKHLYFDLVDYHKVCNFLIKKQMPFALFKEEIAKEFGIPVQFQRFWIWAKRQNHTYRPYRPLTPQEEGQTVGALRDRRPSNAHNADLNLFLEVHYGMDLRPIPPPEKSNEDILLFFKLYHPEKEELRFVGRFFVKSSGKPIEIITRLNELAGFAPDEDIELFEEIKFEPTLTWEHLDKGATFQLSELEDGDVVCFQKWPSPETQVRLRFPAVPSFLEYVKNCQIVHFRSLERPKEDEFCLELAKNHTYDDVVERIAQHLGLDDPSKIRLTPHNCYSQQPEPNPIKYRSVGHLLDLLVCYNHISCILYYEVLGIPLPELQCLKTLKVAFHHATKDEALILNIRLPRQSTVGDVLNEIKTKVELSHPNAELRLLGVFYHKINKIYPVHEKIEQIIDNWTLRAEEIPEDEKNLGPNDQLIYVYHFTKETTENQVQQHLQNFGEPFLLVIHKCETLVNVKECIQKKLKVPEEEFSKWKFAWLSLGYPEYLQDSEIVSNHFQRRNIFGRWEMGLEHSDTTPPRRSYTAGQVSTVPSLSNPVDVEEYTNQQLIHPQNKDVRLIETEVLKTKEGMMAISPTPFGPNQMLRTIQMTTSSTQDAEQRETLPLPAPAIGEQSRTHTLVVDNNVVEEIASELIGVHTMADEIQHIMNLELEEAAPHMSAKLQMILLKIKNSTANSLTPVMEAQLHDLMSAAHDLGMDYTGAQSGITEFEQSAQTYREMDKKVFEAKNAVAVNEASMITLKANIQES